jgi:hypothetical protein
MQSSHKSNAHMNNSLIDMYAQGGRMKDIRAFPSNQT